MEPQGNEASLTELLQTEKDYVRTLNQIIEGYLKPTRSPISPPELKQSVRLIFGNILDIHFFHSEFFLVELSECLTSHDIAECFMRNSEHFYMYSFYCMNKYKSDIFLNTYGGNFFEECRKFLNDKLTLQDLLIAPVQRLTQYQLLLKNLLQSDIEQSSEIADKLQTAISTMASVPKQANDQIHLGMIRSFDGDLSTHGQLLIHDLFKGLISLGGIVTSDTNPNNWDEYRVFLFHFCCIITSTLNDSTYKFVQLIQTCGLSVLVDIPDTTPNRFAICSSKRSERIRLDLKAYSPLQKQTWVHVLQDLIRDQQNLTASLMHPSIVVRHTENIDSQVTVASRFDFVSGWESDESSEETNSECLGRSETIICEDVQNLDISFESGASIDSDQYSEPRRTSSLKDSKKERFDPIFRTGSDKAARFNKANKGKYDFSMQYSVLPKKNISGSNKFTPSSPSPRHFAKQSTPETDSIILNLAGKSNSASYTKSYPVYKAMDTIDLSNQAITSLWDDRLLPIKCGEKFEVFITNLPNLWFGRKLTRNANDDQTTYEGWIPNSYLEPCRTSTLSETMITMPDNPLISYTKRGWKSAGYKGDKLVCNNVLSTTYICKGGSELFGVFAVFQKRKDHERIRQLADICYVINNHPNIPILNTIYLERRYYIFLFSQAGDTPLFEYISNLEVYDEGYAINYTFQLTSALFYLQLRSIIHLDIRPENLMLQIQSDTLKLVDFTCAQFLVSGSLCYNVQNTTNIEFLAPEQVSGRPVHSYTDQWALGVVLYCLISGISPFSDHGYGNIAYNIENAIYTFTPPIFSKISSATKDLITGLLKIEPTTRLSAAECISYPVFVNRATHHQVKLRTNAMKAFLIYRAILLNESTQ